MISIFKGSFMSNLSRSTQMLISLAGSLMLVGPALAQESPSELKPEAKVRKSPDLPTNADIAKKIAGLTEELNRANLPPERRAAIEEQIERLRAIELSDAGQSSQTALSDAKVPGFGNASGGVASATTGTPAPVHADGAPLKFDTTLHDFGKISDETPVSYSFKVVNRGDKTINITGVKASCGCTASAASKMKLEPNDETTIDVRFDPSGRNGPEVKTVTITTDDQAFSSYQLISTSMVAKTVMIEPASVNFGAVPPRTSATQEVSISCKIEGFTIKKAEVTGVQAANLTLEEMGKDTVQLDGVSATRYRYKITSNDKMPIGPISGALSIETNLVSPKFARQNIGIGGEVAGGLALAPQIIYLRMAEAGEAVIGESQLISRTNQPFKILSASIVNATPGMNAVLDIKPREKNNWSAQRLIVSATAPNTAAEIHGAVHIKTDVKDMEDIRLQIVGWQQAPQFAPTTAPVPSPVAIPVAAPKAAAPIRVQIPAVVTEATKGKQ